MASRRTTSKSMEPTKKFKALTPESIARERERARKAMGGGRRGLFWKAPSRGGRATPFSQIMRFLPAVEERGPEGNLLPFFLIAQHWIARTNDDGDEYRAGVTCTDFIREEQPGACERYAKNKVDAVLEKERCLFCQVLEELEEEEDDDGDRTYHHSIPMGGYDKPDWLRRYAYNFAILLPEADYDKDDSDTKVKIYPAPVSVKDGVYGLLSKKQFENLFDPKIGWDLEVDRSQKGNGPWRYAVMPAEKCPVWYPEWDSEMPDLEAASPHWMTREEAVEWMTEAHPEVLAAIGHSVTKRRTGVAAKKGAKAPAKGKASTATSKSGTKASTSRTSKAAPARGTAKTAVTKSKGKKKSSDDEEED